MKKKTRILFIATFPPPVHGSAVVSLQIKNSRLINEVFDGDYLNLGTSRNMDEIGKGGLILNLRKIVRFVGAYIKLLILLLCHHYDLCYCAITINGVGFLKDAPFVLLCHIFRKKIVIHQHNKGMARFVNRPIYHLLYKLVYKNAKVILLSDYLYDDISSIVSKRDIMICPNGINPTLDVNIDRINNKNDVPHILFLSNLIESKGCLILLDACQILKNKGVSFICDFVGGDTKEISTERFKEEIAIRGLKGYCAYHGRKYGQDKKQFWEKADIFAFPTFYYNETFGLVNLEAMDYSLPVISTNEGGIPDVVKDKETGFIIPTKNAIALADAIELLMNSPKLRMSMGEKGRELFLRKFTEEKFESTMLDCLEKCINTI